MRIDNALVSRIITSLLITLLLLLPSVSPAAAKRKIGLLIVNAKVFTADAKGTIAEAVAIDGERIVEVGKSADLRAKYDAAKVLDVKGKLVTPGFNDAHVHFLRGALALLNIDLVGTPSLAAAKEKVAAKVKESKPGEWVIGRGWDHTLWDGKFPNRNDLDAVAPNNPVFLVRVDGHVAWVNSKAIELAGITSAMKSPDGGEIERDPKGEATGILKETAQGLVSRLIPQPTMEQQRKGLELALKMAREYGITSVQDNSGYETTKLYREAMKQGKLTVRVSEWQNFEDSVAEIKRQREEFASFKDDSTRLKLGALKGYVDGTLGSKTASMLAPFTDDAMNSGIPRKSPEELTRMIVERAKEGWQIALHAIGDRANRMALDGFAEIQTVPQVSVHSPLVRSSDGTISWGTNFFPKKTQFARHRIEHAQVVAPSDFKRFAELGIIASMQPSHAITDQRWADSRLGEYRVLGAYAWHMMKSYDVHVPFGTDFPVESIDPYRTLFSAVARQEENGNPLGGWNPQERLSMADAIRCHTYESAYAEFAERDKGTIEAGKLADLVVHSNDLLTIDPLDILKTRPVYTIFNGTIVYGR